MTWTECADADFAVTVPDATSVLNVSVVDTCQSTGTSAVPIPPRPSAFSGEGARRVQSTTLVESGSPEAMPSWNGYGTAAVAAITAERTGRALTPAAASPPRTRDLRLIGLMRPHLHGYSGRGSPGRMKRTVTSGKP